MWLWASEQSPHRLLPLDLLDPTTPCWGSAITSKIIRTGGARHGLHFLLPPSVLPLGLFEFSLITALRLFFFKKKGINLPIFPRLYSLPDHVPKRFYFLSSRQTPRFSRYSLNFQTRSKFLNYLNLIKSDNVLGRNVDLRVLHDLDYQAQNTAASLNQRL